MRHVASLPLRSASHALLAVVLLGLALIATTPAEARVPRNFFGTMAVFPGNKDFHRMGKVGLGAYRFGISWRGVQPTRRSEFHWGAVDESVRSAAMNGLQPTPTLIGTPRFISKSGKVVAPTEPEELSLWHRFLVNAARRYGPGGQFWLDNPTVPAFPVRRWIIWNEQNAVPFWAPKPSVRDYAKLVEVSDRAISAIDPTAKLILGGMYGYPRAARSLSAQRFLRRLYRVRGIERHFEAVSLHPYGSGVGAVRTQIKEARAVLRRVGDRRAGILLGEMGWASDGPSGSPEVVGAKGQARRLRAAMKLLAAKRRRWNLLGAFIYLWRDFDVETACLWCPHAGLVTKRGREKPALRAVKQVIRANTAG